jgi:hypothetical protein
MLAANWLDSALDLTFDPIHTMLRDHLRDEGTIRVIPFIESPSAGLEMLQLDLAEYTKLQVEWDGLDLPHRCEGLSNLIRPAVLDGDFGVARLEELVWMRVLRADWSSDMASQLNELQQRWEEDDPHAITNQTIEALLSMGHLVL